MDKHYERIKDSVPLELYEKIQTSVPLDRLSALLQKDVRNCSDWYLHTGKYVQKMDLYLSEKLKMFCDIGLHDETGLRILDIGTGIGLFPWLCKLGNHYCESTYYDYFEFYKDAWSTLDIITPFFFEVKCNQPWDLPPGNRYDIICSMRTVFDRVPHPWTVSNWLHFLEEAEKHLNLNGKVIIKTNRVEGNEGFEGDNIDLDQATIRLLEPYFLDGYNSRTFLINKEDIKGLIG